MAAPIVSFSNHDYWSKCYAVLSTFLAFSSAALANKTCKISRRPKTSSATKACGFILAQASALPSIAITMKQ